MRKTSLRSRMTGWGKVAVDENSCRSFQDSLLIEPESRESVLQCRAMSEVTRSYPKSPWNDAFWNVSTQKSLRHLRGVGDRDRSTTLLLCIDRAIQLIRVIFATLFLDFLKIKCKEVAFEKRSASSDSDLVMDAVVAPAGPQEA